MLIGAFSCVGAAKFGPDPIAAVNSGVLNKAWAVPGVEPVHTFTGVPPAKFQPTDHNLFAAKFNGINSMVCKCRYSTICPKSWRRLTAHLDAYSGAILFMAFLSEMRHPVRNSSRPFGLQDLYD